MQGTGVNDSQDIGVVLLAGGRGTRLHPYTAVFPKPLVPLGDTPVLELLLRRLRRHGLRNITICTGHLAELIRSFFGDGDRFGVRIRYAKEDQPLGTAGPLALVRDLTETFVVMNGDLLTTLDFSALIDYHKRQNAEATIGAYSRTVRIDFGVLEADERGLFRDYREKPQFQFEVSMGVYVLNRSILRFIEPGRPMDMPDLILQSHANGGRVACYRSDCYWLDIGRADDYAEAQRQFETDPTLFLADLPGVSRPR